MSIRATTRTATDTRPRPSTAMVRAKISRVVAMAPSGETLRSSVSSRSSSMVISSAMAVGLMTAIAIASAITARSDARKS